MFVNMNIGGMTDTFSCTFDITYGNQVRHDRMTAPQIMLEQRFLNYVQQAVDIQAPVKIKMSRTGEVWSQYDNHMIPREYSITFRNKSYENTFGLEEDGAT